MILKSCYYRLLLTCCLVTACLHARAQQNHTEEWNDGIKRSLVFCPGDYGSRFYRIPAIVSTSDGTLVALADKRIEHNGDLPAKIDIVCRRSLDGGATWSPYVTVAAHDSVGGCGDAALVFDKNTGDLIAIFSHGNGLWQNSPAHISLSRSHDNGITWEKPVDINPQILTSDSLGSQPIKCTSAFASSGRALQLSDGRIIFALVTRKAGNKHFKVYAVYSDDGGYNWKVSSNPASEDGDEAKIVELSDGSLIMSIRNRFGSLRKFSYSKDRGETWSEPIPIESLPDPRCNGDIIRYDHDGKNVLLHSLPSDPNERNNIAIFVSEDNGKNWYIGKKVVTTPSAYSSMTIMQDGSIGILTEESQNNHYSYNIWFTRIPIKAILLNRE